MGWGAPEAPRGALGHWMHIKERAIAIDQMVVPTTWDGSPRDATGARGAWEEALVGTAVARRDRRRSCDFLAWRDPRAGSR